MHCVLGLFQLGDDALNEVIDGFRVALLDFKDIADVVFHLLEFFLLLTVLVEIMTDLVNVINRVEDLVRFFLGLVLHPNLVFELRVQLGVLSLDFLDFILNLLHLLALVVHLTSHHVDLALFLLKNLLSLSRNQRLPLLEPLVFLLEINKAVAEPQNGLLALGFAAFRLVRRRNNFSQFFVFDDFLQKSAELFVGLKLLRPFAKLDLLPFDFLPEVLDLVLKAEHLFFVGLQLFVFLLAFEGRLDHDRDVGLHCCRHLLLLLSELLGFLVQLLGLGNNLLLLIHEFVVDLALLPLLLEQPHGLKWTLGLHHEGTHLVQIFVGNLLL